MTQDIKSQVLSIVKDIELGMKYEECPDCGSTNFDEHNDCECGNHMTLHGFDYISDVLDVNWVLDHNREFKGARLLVAFGGPNIWIDTTKQTVEGHWWGDSFTASYSRDEMDIEGACSEWFSC